MSNQAVDLVSLGAMFSLIATLLLQLLKPVIELIPNINLKANQAAHDNLLRLVQYLINFGLLLLASRTAPSVFAGLQWWDLVSLSIGQGILSHVTYSLVSQGGSQTLGDTSPSSGLPVIPRG